MLIEDLDQAFDLYCKQRQDDGFADCQIMIPSLSACQETAEGFEIRNGTDLLAFITYEGELIEANDYLEEHPERFEV